MLLMNTYLELLHYGTIKTDISYMNIRQTLFEYDGVLYKVVMKSGRVESIRVIS